MRGKLALLLLCAAAPIAAHDEGDCSAFSCLLTIQLSSDDADTVGIVVTAVSKT